MLSVSAAPDKCVYLHLNETPAGSTSAGEPQNDTQSKDMETVKVRLPSRHKYRLFSDAASLHDSCRLTGYCIFDQTRARESMFSFKLLSKSAAVIEQHHLTQTNDGELKMKNDKLDLK